MNSTIPELLWNKLLCQYGDKAADEIAAGFVQKPVTLRVNTLKSSPDEIIPQLAEAGLTAASVPWYNSAFIITDSAAIHSETVEKITALPMYKEGKIYLQSLSAMIPPVVLNPQKGEAILDMTAAPGGKTTQLSSLSSDTALITACERDAIRCQRLQHNIDTQGCRKVNVMNQDSRQLSDYFAFDKVLLDAPCTGSGTITDDEEKTRRMTADWVSKINRTQKQLMQKAVKLLKKGSEMVYSTCSVLESENEDVVRYAMSLGCEILPLENIDLSGIPSLPTTLKNVLCVMPSPLYEGFFIARLRKTR